MVLRPPVSRSLPFSVSGFAILRRSPRTHSEFVGVHSSLARRRGARRVTARGDSARV